MEISKNTYDRFWILIYHLVLSVTGVNLRENLEQALFNVPIPDIPTGTRKLIYFIFLAAKLAIASSWKTQLLSLYLVKSKLGWIMVHCRLSSIMNNAQSLVDAGWKPWMSYLEGSS